MTLKAPSPDTTTHMAESKKIFYVLLIVALAPIGQMGIDIFTPSLPLIARQFSSNRELVQLSVSIYLAIFAIGQLIYGPLSDSFGRKPTLIAGLLIFLFGSIITLAASTIEIFIFGRMIQGLGITSASVLMRAIATDIFKQPRLGHVLTYMVIGWGMGPIVAPVIGAAFQTTIGWHYSLVFLAVYAAILLGMALRMKETNQSMVKFNLPRLASNITEIYGNRRFLMIFLAMGFCYGSILSFNLIGPFIIQEVMQFSPAIFGFIALSLGLVYFLGVFSNRIMPTSLTPTLKFSVASKTCLLAASVQLVLAFTADLNILALVIPFAIVVFFSGVMYPNLMGMGVAAFPHIAGLASSLLGFSLMLIAAAIMLLSSLMQVGSLVPFALLTLGLMAGVFSIIRFLHP